MLVNAGVSAPPAFSLAQVIQQLRTQWGGSFEGTTMSWSGSGAIPYYINGTPYASGSGEIPYKTGMTSLMVTRATLAFELWDDLIARDLNPVSTAASAQIQFMYATQTYNANNVLSTNGGTYSDSSLSSNGASPYGTANYRITRDELWFNSNWTSHDQDSDMYYGGYGFLTYIHEIGHSLGLSHPGTYNAGNNPITYANNAEYTQDNRQYTVMSYFGGYSPAAGWQQDGTFNNWYYSSTPMLHDVAAIQSIYGADMTTRAGDTTYGFNSNAGREVFDFNVDLHPIVTIWDAGGNDTVDLSGYSANQRIDLNAGIYSDVGGMFGNFAIAYNVTLETAIGGSGSDTIIGNAAANTLKGNGGNDTIDGRDGIDTAIFSGLRSSYALTDLGGGSVRVAGPDGTDTVSNVERLQFADVTMPWPSMPDLVVGNFLLGSTTASYTVFNIGSGPADGSASHLYFSADSTITTSDTPLALRATPALGGGGADTVTVSLALPTNLTPGTYYLGVVADVAAQVAEANETNNTAVLAIILGNNSANTLSGTSGEDVFYGLGGNDIQSGGAGADLMIGGTGADKFVFDGASYASAQSGFSDRITDYDQSGGVFSAAEGDQIDLSAILSAAYNGGAGQPVGALVRVVAAGPNATLQVDPDGSANGVKWTTLIRLDGIRTGHSLNVILDAAQPAGVHARRADLAAVQQFRRGWFHRHPVAEQQRHARGVADERHQRRRDGPCRLQSGTAWHEIDVGRFQRRRQGRHPLAERRRHAGRLADERRRACWRRNARSPIRARPGTSKAPRDFNGDGKADILWQNDDGTAGVWLMNGTSVLSTGGATSAQPWTELACRWTPATSTATARPTSSGRTTTARPRMWLMDGTSVLSTGTGRLAIPAPPGT